MDITLQEKQKTIALLKFLLNEEISKPLGEMNSEAVDNYMKIIFLLQDKCINLSPELIDEQVRKAFRKEENTASPEAVKTTKKYFNKKKAWLVAACIAILVALFSVISFSSERSVKDMLEEYLGTFEFISFGEEVDVGNKSYGKIGDSEIYESIEELAKKEKIDLLYPANADCEIEFISVSETDGKETIDVSYSDCDMFLTLTLNSVIPQEILDICNDTITLNGNKYYLCIMEDVNEAQAYFVYDDNMYRIIHNNKADLIEVLENMEIIKYED